MKPFDWNEQKNTSLKATRGIGFEDIVNAIADGCLITVLQYPNKAKYSNQNIYIVRVQAYVYAVPYIETKDVNFLKNIYPSRKYTKQFLTNSKES